MYGIQCFDADGTLSDFNFDKVLVTEGVVCLGNRRSGRIPLDVLFPMRDKFKGVFIMPVWHSFSSAQPWENGLPVFLAKGYLHWDAWSEGIWDNVNQAGGAFAGRQFIYGYYN